MLFGLSTRKQNLFWRWCGVWNPHGLQNNHCLIKQSLELRQTLLQICFFCVFFLREGGTTTFLISYRTIRRWVKLVQIAVSKVVGSGRMRCFYLLFTSAFSRRPLSPIRDNAQQTRRDLSFPVSNCKPSC